MTINAIIKPIRTRLFLLLSAPLLLGTPAMWAAEATEESVVDLLRAQVTTVAGTSLLGQNAAELGKLHDDIVETEPLVRIESDRPFDLTFSLADQTVTLEKLTVDFGKQDDESRPACIELLASTISPHAGFRSVRVCRIDAVTTEQSYSFVPTAARWIMVRVTPHPGERRISLAPIKVVGRLAPPKTNYEFQQSPAQALEVIAQLKKLVPFSVSNDEAKLFSDAADGRLDEHTFAEAALIASGITKADARVEYLKAIDELTTEFEQSGVDGQAPFAQGEKLLTFLHGGPLRNGYRAEQTRLSTILDEQTYNCVSSATLYNVIGRRVGLDVRAIEVPDHAFSILYDGARHADVEATTPGGFNPSRDLDALKKFSDTTGMNYIADSHPDQRREIDELGLAAVIYYNRAVADSESDRHATALVRYFCALSLDPEFSSAVKNSLSTLANWGVQLADQEQYESALSVINAGLQLAPLDATLLNNRIAVWNHRISAVVDAGNSQQALSLVRTADAQVSGDEFRAMEAWVFLRPAETLIEQGRWTEALQLAESGLGKVNVEAGEELTNWCQGLYIRWSIQCLDQEAYSQALAVLERGLKQFPSDSRIANNLGYTAQELAKQLRQQGKLIQAEAMLMRLLAAYPQAELNSVATGHFVSTAQSLATEGRHDEALSLVCKARKSFTDHDDFTSICRILTDQWAQSLAVKKEFGEAVAAYRQTLLVLPGDEHLVHNHAVMIDQWLQQQLSQSQWITAAKTLRDAQEKLNAEDYQNLSVRVIHTAATGFERRQDPRAFVDHLVQLLTLIPDAEPAKDVAGRHIQSIAAELARSGNYSQAIQALELAETKLKPKDSFEQVLKSLYAMWASQLLEQRKFQESVTVFRDGLRRFPQDQPLAHNAAVAWDAWATTYIESRQWDQAIEVYGQALKSLPDAQLLQNNLAYCKQQRLR